MPQVTDPVCGMSIDSVTAAGVSQYDGRTFYFCSEECKRQFDADPGRFAERVGSMADRAESLERHEPPYTNTDGFLAPKFGAAGSGGAEYERLPEAHDRDNPPRGER
jgi:YHS domain-containing protein